MRWRYWTSIAAIFGVLLHVSALARHNAFAFEAASGDLVGVELLSSSPDQLASGVICGHEHEQDGSKQPDTGWKFCPICAGFATTFALEVAVSALDPPQYDLAKVPLPGDKRSVFASARYLPASRGPPALIS